MSSKNNGTIMASRTSEHTRAARSSSLFPHSRQQRTHDLDRLRGKYAIVTGGDSGIGRAVALLYAIEGLKGITISYLPQEKEDAKKAAEQITKEGCDVNLVEVDLQREEDCRKVVEGHLKVFEHLDVLVNNASSGFDLQNER